MPRPNVGLYREVCRRSDLFILPSVIRGSGQFPDASPRVVEAGRSFSLDEIRERHRLPDFFADWERAIVVVNLSLAIQTKVALERLAPDAGSAIFVEGGFSQNAAYLALLATLFPDQCVQTTNLQQASALGCAITVIAAADSCDPHVLQDRISIEPNPIAPWDDIDLPGYSRALSGAGCRIGDASMPRTSAPLDHTDETLLSQAQQGGSARARLEALAALAEQPTPNSRERDPTAINNHVHTIYSFSPYTPTAAALRARQEGLAALGIVDHDTVAGAAEIEEAGKRLSLATTVGCEVRVNATATPLEGRRINDPTTHNIFYMVLHAIPIAKRAALQSALAPIRQARRQRLTEMTQRLTALLKDVDWQPLDFAKDVVALSQWEAGGTLTERHLLYALARRLVETFWKDPDTVDNAQSHAAVLEMTRWCKRHFGISFPPSVRQRLADSANHHRPYDLLAIFKAELLPAIFIPPNARECPPAAEMLQLAERSDAIAAYPYLGGVDPASHQSTSKTNAQFEDPYLDLLMPTLRHMGFRAITYMPPRNSQRQLERVAEWCRRLDLLEISGVDVNSPRQNFRYMIDDPAMQQRLIDSTWALIAHERAANLTPSLGLLHAENPWAAHPLTRRVARYAAAGRTCHATDNSALLAALQATEATP